MPKKVTTMSFRIDVDLLEELRDVAYWNRVSISSIVEEAIREKLNDLIIRDGVCPSRNGDLRGRPIGKK